MSIAVCVMPSIVEAAQTNPLPLAASVDRARLLGHDLSPDGRLLVLSYYNEAGLHLRIINQQTGESIEPAPAGAQSAGGVWSPDGQQLAYTSDEGGTPGLWIWDLRTRQRRQIAGVAIVAVGLRLSWFPDGRHLLTALWPEGEQRPRDDLQTRAESLVRPPFPPHSDDQASVFILRSGINAGDSRDPVQDRTGHSAPETRCLPQGIFGLCDLGIVDLDGGITPIARRIHLAWFYQPSPDGRHVAYTVFDGNDPANADQLYSLVDYDVGSRTIRTLASDLRLFGGARVSWAPNSRQLAFVSMSTGERQTADRISTGAGALGIVAVDAPSAQSVRWFEGPLFTNRRQPWWSDRSDSILVLGSDRVLWLVDAVTGVPRRVAGTPAEPIDALYPIAAGGGVDVRSSAGVVVVSQRAEGHSGLYRLNLQAGTMRPLVERLWHIDSGRIDANRDGNVLTFTASDQLHRNSVWQIGTDGGLRVADNLNSDVNSSHLGAARIIRWNDAGGVEHRAALLLPPDYRPGRKLPTVIWVYGGASGSRSIGNFGLVGDGETNMQVLATRGYAVLYPDMPSATGNPAQDIMTDVLPAVDAVISQGYADSDRIAVMGHSFGSYNALCLITRTRRFRSAIISGVVDPDLVSASLMMSPNGESSEMLIESGQFGLAGSAWQYPERYRANSPIFAFDQIRTPVLIGQGEIDGNTPKRGADSVFVALRRLGKPVEYRLYEGEGHSFRRTVNIVDWWRARLDFLARTLDVALDRNGAVIFDGDRVRPTRAAQATR